MECHLSSVNDAADENGLDLDRTEVAMVTTLTVCPILASRILEMSL